MKYRNHPQSWTYSNIKSHQNRKLRQNGMKFHENSTNLFSFLNNLFDKCYKQIWIQDIPINVTDVKLAQTLSKFGGI